eukprot:scaffold351418_cov37-Prasinocladus_malaysianus.AAC.1
MQPNLAPTYAQGVVDPHKLQAIIELLQQQQMQAPPPNSQNMVSAQDNYSYQPLPKQPAPVPSVEVAAAAAFAQGSPSAFLLQHATAAQHQLPHIAGGLPLSMSQPSVPPPLHPPPAAPAPTGAQESSS